MSGRRPLSNDLTDQGKYQLAHGSTRHTPGPWTVDHERIGPAGDPVALLCDTTASTSGTVVEWPRLHSIDGDVDDTENEANAYLIASAPELLEVLEEVANDIESYCDDWNSSSPTDVTVVLPILRTAIAKAKGGA